MTETDEKAARPAARRTREGSGRTTLEEVARRSGVSTATVSRAFNRPDKVSEAVRERVLAAARAVNWVPNAAGRALASSRTHIVGAIIPTLDDEIFARQIAGMQQIFSARGFNLLIACSNYDPREGHRQADAMIAGGVEALAMVGETHPAELFESLARLRIPYVLTYSFHAAASHPLVGFDNRQAFERITRHLLALGHRRFGVVLQPCENNDRAVARLFGIRSALAAAGIELVPRHLQVGPATLDFGMASFRRLMDEPPGQRPTALVCGNDTLALGALLAAAQAGVRVPEEVSVTGFDDLAIASRITPGLTTMAVDNRAIGVAAARQLLACLDGTQAAPRAVELVPELIVRRSTAQPPCASACPP